MKTEGSPLEARLGHRFRDQTLLCRALTPPSAGLADHNQRLEFLGDALLNAAVALLIHQEKPDWDEGAMSKLRGTLVCTAALEAWAADLGLTLRTGPRSPRKSPSPKSMADGLEALLAAAHEDAGTQGFTEVLRICRRRYQDPIRRANRDDWKRQDAKTALQERAAALALPSPGYQLQARSGPDHAPLFVVEVSIGPRRASGAGATRKGAETEAARAMLELLAR